MNSQIQAKDKKSVALPLFAVSAAMAIGSADEKTSDILDVTGIAVVNTRIRLSPIKKIESIKKDWGKIKILHYLYYWYEAMPFESSSSQG
jgi:hypothetical protein